MKTTRFVLVALSLSAVFAIGLSAQETQAEVAPVPGLNEQELEELLGPVALHPDSLVALILPASTVPGDIVLAARYLDSGGDSNAVDDRPWDESVRALARYPDLVRWLDKDLEWTIRVGEAFLAQPAEVMKAIQRLRARARAAGTLTDTPQQRVIVEDEVISIVPAVRDVIYVPYYDPAVVYVSYRDYYRRPYISFGFGFPIGSWLSFECDWFGRRIWYSGWHRYRHIDRDRYCRVDRFPGLPHYFDHPGRQPWVPSPRHQDRRDRRYDRRDDDRRSSVEIVRTERREPERTAVANPWRPGTTIPATRSTSTSRPAETRSVVRVETRRQRDVSAEFGRVVERETRHSGRSEAENSTRRTNVIRSDDNRAREATAPSFSLPPQQRSGSFSAPSYSPQPQQPQYQPPPQPSARDQGRRGDDGGRNER